MTAPFPPPEEEFIVTALTLSRIPIDDPLLGQITEGDWIPERDAFRVDEPTYRATMAQYGPPTISVDDIPEPEATNREQRDNGIVLSDPTPAQPQYLTWTDPGADLPPIEPATTFNYDGLVSAHEYPLAQVDPEWLLGFNPSVTLPREVLQGEEREAVEHVLNKLHEMQDKITEQTESVLEWAHETWRQANAVRDEATQGTPEGEAVAAEAGRGTTDEPWRTQLYADLDSFGIHPYQGAVIRNVE